MASDYPISIVVTGVTLTQAKLASNAILGMFPRAEVSIETQTGICLKPKVIEKEHY